MNGEVIKSFLVSLGFGVDEGSLAKFNKSIASAAVRVTALYATVKVAAAGVVFGLAKISEGFEQLGYEYRIIAPAINKALVLRRELLRAYSAAGINITKVVQASVKLNMSLAKTKFAFEAIYKSVGSKFFGILTQQSDLFRQRIYANMPKIQATLEKLVKFIFKALEATTTLGLRLWSILERVYEFFVILDRATGGWSTAILGVLAAWKLLNLSFLATPFGMLLAGFVAILALFDDFKTWQEGGKSLFDWSSFVPVIQSVTAALTSVWEVLQGISDVLGNVALAIYETFRGNGSAAIDALADAGRSLLGVFSGVWDAIKGIGSSLGAVGEWVSNLNFGNIAANLGLTGNGGGIPAASPVGGAVHNAQTNQHVQQQTSINVIGSADASAVGKAVSSEQGKVNFDMVRNMRGATR